MRSDTPPFVPELLAVLADRGPLTTAELAPELGVTEAELQRELQARGDVVDTTQGWLFLPVVAEGSVFTRMVTAAELELGVLLGDGDLDLWARLADEGWPLAGGGQVRTVYTGDRLPPGAAAALSGPAGWLDGVGPDDLVTLRMVDGELQLEVVEELSPPTESTLGTLLKAAGGMASEAEREGDGPGVLVDDVVLEVLLRDRSAFTTPLPPLSVLLSLGGLEVVRGLVGMPGTDWDGGLGARGLEVEQRVLLGRGRSVLLLAATRGHLLQSADVPDPTPVLAADPEVLETLAYEVARNVDLAGGLPSLAAAAGTDAGRAAVAYLQAMAADADGQAEQAEQHLAQALAAAPRLAPALRLAGHYAAERSDPHAADGLYRRAGDPVDRGWRQVLREFLQPPPAGLGRNRPCACGSGRKAKLCCEPAGRHPLPQRALWRYRRALLFAVQSTRDSLLPDLTLMLAGEAGDLHETVGDPVVPDLALFEGGVLSRYLAERGALMPPDERDLVERWVTAPLQLLEVTATEPGRALTVRGLPDGEPTVVRDRLGSADVERLDLLLGRLLDDGQELRFLGPPRFVPRTRRTSVLEALATGDPRTIAAALAPAGPPELLTREGQPVVFCTARFVVPDLDAAWARLAATLDADDGEPGTLTDTVAVDDDDDELIVRGWVRRTDDGLEVETNAEERFERLLALVRSAAPSAELVEQSRTPAAQALAEGRFRSPPGPVTAPPPELAQLLAEQGEKLERRWLDESVPALGGRTPREAAADPAARAELEALLDDFAWQEREGSGPAVMQAARLRAALGLPAR